MPEWFLYASGAGVIVITLRQPSPWQMRASAAAASLLLAALVSGCAGISDETLDAVVTDPGKYILYNCSDFDKIISSTTIRMTELEQLIARASQGPGGAVMSAVAY